GRHVRPLGRIFLSQDRSYQGPYGCADLATAAAQHSPAITASDDRLPGKAHWADLVGIDVSDLQRTTLKKHNPKTVRENTGDGYHGCLVIRVLQAAELYRRIEGWWCGIVGAATSAD
ncbi:hypothetical protein ACWDA7_18865, partial [Streptomyces sp. NPDC001156]